MADDLRRREPVHLHQALHGYADGHRLLASSVPLKSRDARLMLTLSDASGSSSRIDDDGYITGYPLGDAGLYAFAKTWSAPEMPRPGCVWTHTLLLDFADLATLATLVELPRAFRRPVEDDARFEFYEGTLALGDVTSGSDSCAPTDPALLRRLAWALYGQPSARVFSSEGTLQERASAVLLLWGQQWPRLRRAFRFCTLAYADRSSEAAPFDLQFVPSERSIRGRFAKLFDADHEPSDSPRWLENAIEDVVERGPAPSLRTFLREVGAEVNGGRELFEPLSRIHCLLNDPGASIAGVVDLLVGPLKDAAARDVRLQVVGRVGAAALHASRTELKFALDHLDLLDGQSRSRVEDQLAAALWSMHPDFASECLAGDDPNGRSLALRGLSHAKPDDLLGFLREHALGADTILDQRRDLLARPELWRLGGDVPATALAVAKRGRLSDASLDAMIDSSNRALATPASDIAGAPTVLAVLAARLEARHGDKLSADEEVWFRKAASPNSLAATLAHGVIRERSTFAAWARYIGPDEVPNEYGEDPCWTAFRGAREESAEPTRLFLRGWLLARGLGERSRNQGDLIAAGIEEIYPSAIRARLPDETWQLLRGRLPDSRFWAEWDRGRRLRAAVADAFVSRELDPLAFGKLMQDDALFAEIASEASRLLWGRGYLRRVKRALQEVSPVSFATRIAIIQQLV